MNDKKLYNIYECSACGEDHLGVDARVLFTPDDEGYTHWFMCDKTQRVVYIKEESHIKHRGRVERTPASASKSEVEIYLPEVLEGLRDILNDADSYLSLYVHHGVGDSQSIPKEAQQTVNRIRGKLDQLKKAGL